MRLFIPGICAVALLAARPAQAQADSSAPPAFSPWSVGLRAGTGINPLAETSEGAFTAFSGGITGSYDDAVRRCSIQLGAWLEDEQLNPYRTGIAHNALLVVPLLLRTGAPGGRFHVVVGGGPVFHLTEQAISGVYPDHYEYRHTAGCLITGLEVRLSPPKKVETSLSLTLRVPFGYSLERRNYNSRPPSSPYPDRVSTGWLGATFNVYLHRAARP